MGEIVPAVLAETPDGYARDIAVATALHNRVQIDISDGVFAANKTLNLVQVYWPDNIKADLHLMVNDPLSQLSMVAAQSPHLVIFHAEAVDVGSESFTLACTQLHALSIKVGLALLQETDVSTVVNVLDTIDHVLIFTGKLGHYGGSLQESCLIKAQQIKKAAPTIEVGVDGGVNADNISTVIAAGVDVVNVGSYLQKADNPQAAYATLKAAI